MRRYLATGPRVTSLSRSRKEIKDNLRTQKMAETQKPSFRPLATAENVNLLQKSIPCLFPTIPSPESSKPLTEDRDDFSIDDFEILLNESILDSPFPPSHVGGYSHHGMEPTYLGLLRPSSCGQRRAFEPKLASINDKVNQDRGNVVHPYSNEQIALFGVFDGHGDAGEELAQFVLDETTRRLKAHPSFLDDTKTAIKEVFVSIDKGLARSPENLSYIGTTACIILIHGERIFIANVGDSRAVLGRHQSESNLYSNIDLTTDHKPHCLRERHRIERMGGYVKPPPFPGLTGRVWKDKRCVEMGLAMSRSIGDLALKKSGVIPDPDVYEYQLNEDIDQFIILASDGLWEFVSSQDAVQIVGNIFNREGNDEKAALEASKALMLESVKRWQANDREYRDDITVIVLKLKGIWKSLKNENRSPSSSFFEI